MKTVRPITTPYRHSPFCRSELRLYFESASFIRKSAGNTVSRQADLSGSCPFSGWKISPRGVISALSYPEHSTMTEKKRQSGSIPETISYSPIGIIHSEHAIAQQTPAQPVFAQDCQEYWKYFHPIPPASKISKAFPIFISYTICIVPVRQNWWSNLSCRMSNMAYSPHVRPCVPTPSV